MPEVKSELTPEEEKLCIRDISISAEAQTKEGDTFYLITQRWWHEWLEYVNQNQINSLNDGSASEYCALKRPSSIDNSDIIYEATSESSVMGIELRDTLVEGTDYILLPQEVWNQLYTWYGGGPILARKVISSGLSQTELAVEVYPLRLQLHLMPNDECSTIRISKKETIGELHKKASKIFNLNPEQVCIWDYFSHQKHALMNDMEKTLDDANIQMDQDGELALAFGDLLRKLWAPGRTPVAPRPFKTKLARFAPQFSGYNQHDSQELLAFLLDGLHEDLNRVKHKPYIKSKDADGRPDEEVADEYWANHIARNDSIIVDVCQGQYKSTLVCPVCNKVSVTFDPFMYLSLPLQSATTRSMTVTIFTCDGSALPSACTVTVPKQGRCRDLIQALANACSLKPNEKFLLAEIRGHLIHRYLEDPLISLSSIKDDDHLAVYKIPKLVKSSKFLQLIHRREEREVGISQSSVGWKPYGTPLVSPISCDDIITRGDIQSIVYKMLSPMLRTENPGYYNFSSAKTSVAASNSSSATGTSEACKDSGVADTNEKLPLQLVDENNACIDLTIGEDKAVKVSSSSKSILVFIDWPQQLLENYDTHYLENLPEVTKYGSVTKKARTEPLSLYSCLEAFLREEPLVPEDMWYCPQCKERRQASKKLDLWRLPEVLVIHLKRFSYSRSMKHKLETFVNFPIHDFDVTKYVANKNNSQRQLYELYALTNHYGGMGSGHYTAHIKLLDENRWYNFDDSHISPINEEDVKSAAAYVLFYRRVKTDDNSASNGIASSGGHHSISSRK
ncbi:PREDICTED: ubiquitin carboxyl-terminal hydrolase 5 isoform X2 [Ipomoea nil]|uniref:ubiquitin carboxyl-terminal hydrolase 5 isoform X2 n=1 Tax=Ipomoea nil TaxID=35883 RepID=UPI000901D349|nr:PREDICTED: ubiquitin carboxyl-terminal hydrolase 5 isoform X2 [Ipomoea nil]